MPCNQPESTLIYRIVHIENMAYLLENGLYNRSQSKANPEYINIGDGVLIEQRQTFPVGVDPPGGNLGDYIPFYFGPLSPMLLKIKTGCSGIIKRDQADIVYVVCRVSDIIATCEDWCFTNGHGKNKFTLYFNDIKNLDKISWDIVKERYWAASADDMDRMRVKQAEFLVKNHVPVNCIMGIVVYNENSLNVIRIILEELNLIIKVAINPRGDYYY